jgi:predicted nuclease of predicted toxin-antitoxin system
MKFLIDAQLPKSLSDLLRSRGLDSIHTTDLLRKNASSDLELLNVSVNESRIIVTKDRDFIDSYFLKGLPKKLILVRTGNVSNVKLQDIFERNFNLIIELISKSDLIEISQLDIVEHGKNPFGV